MTCSWDCEKPTFASADAKRFPGCRSLMLRLSFNRKHLFRSYFPSFSGGITKLRGGGASADAADYFPSFPSFQFYFFQSMLSFFFSGFWDVKLAELRTGNITDSGSAKGKQKSRFNVFFFFYLSVNKHQNKIPLWQQMSHMLTCMCKKETYNQLFVVAALF